MKGQVTPRYIVKDIRRKYFFLAKSIGLSFFSPWRSIDLRRGMAQLVARMHGVHEAVGSSPATPTKCDKNSKTKTLIRKTLLPAEFKVFQGFPEQV